MGVKCSPSNKKDGNIRFCVDYRKLNSLTQKDDYPCLKSIPAIDILSGAVCFSTLDLCFTGSKYTPWRQPNYLHVPLGNLPFPHDIWITQCLRDLPETDGHRTYGAERPHLFGLSGRYVCVQPRPLWYVTWFWWVIHSPPRGVSRGTAWIGWKS